MARAPAHVLIAGCGDLGQRVAQRLNEYTNIAAVYGLRRHPPLPSSGEPPRGAPSQRGHAGIAQTPGGLLTGGLSSSGSLSGDLLESDSLAGGRLPGPGRQTPGNRTLHWLAGDMCDPATLGELPRGITHVLFAGTPDSRDEAAYRAVFLDGPRKVLHALRDRPLGRIVFVSSSAVYGEHQGNWVDESTSEAPLGSNGRILLDAERQLAAQGVSATSLRLAGLYGPGRLRLIERLRTASAPAPVHPVHWSNRIHIDDAAQACALLLMAPNVAPVYIGADDLPLPLHELYAHLAALIGAPPPPVGSAPRGVGSKRLSNRRLREAGFVPRWPDARAGYAALLASPYIG